MNPKLVSIYRYATEREREHVTLREAVRATGYSEKQIKRDVNVWKQAGWVVYRPGKGRGHESVIQFVPSFGQTLMTWVESSFAHITMTEAAKWLEWEWPPVLREKIQAHIWGRFGFEQTEEDRFVFPRTRPLASLDPLDIHIAMEASLARQLFDRLFEWDGNMIRPSLAHHIEATRFGFRLYIRKGVLFHNGMSLSAKEVVYSLNRLLRYGKQRWLFAPIEQVDSPAPYIVDIYTSAHRGYIERLLAQTPASISYKGFEGTVGTGPFKLDQVSEDVTRFRAFDRGLRPRPSLDVVEFVTFSESDYTEWSTRDDHHLVKWIAEAGARYAVFNMRHSWLKDAPDVRRTILETIDKTELVALGGERHQVAHGFFPDASRAFERDVSARVDTRSVRLLHLPYATATEDALLIAKQLTAAGFVVETTVYTLSTLFEEETLRRADVILCGEMMNEDLDLAFLAFLTSELSLVGNLLAEDETLRTMMDRYHQVDLDVWPHLHREVERYVTEAAYVIPLYHVARERRFPTFLGNVPIDIYGHPRYEQLWIRPSI